MREVYRYIIIFLIALLALPCMADVLVVLQDGRTVAGQLILRNDEVIVVRDAEGQRFQYLMSEVETIDENYTLPAEPVKEEPRGRRVAVNIQLSGGVAILPNNGAGGYFSVMAHVGACNVFDKRLFLGGGIGYFGTYMSDGSYAFIPIVFRAEIPLKVARNSPYLGASVGYGLAPKKDYRGGIHGQIDAGWRWQLGQSAAVFAGVNFGVQQGTALLTEIINDTDYSTRTTLTFCTIGAKMSIQF